MIRILFIWTYHCKWVPGIKLKTVNMSMKVKAQLVMTNTWASRTPDDNHRPQ